MFCFICESNFNEVTQLVYHLKKVHEITAKDTLRCFDCSQLFKDISSYKRHILRKHVNKDMKNEPEIESATQTQDILQTVPCSSNFDSYNLGDNSTENVAEVDNGVKKFNLSESLEYLMECSLKFLVTLHSNHNFSRKDVYEIKDNVMTLIVNPLLQIFQEFSSTTLSKYTIIQNEISSIISNCKDLFKACRSDYMLTQQLKSADYICDVKEFVIDNEVDVMYKKGELKYDEKISKGVILPLQHQFKKILEKDNNFENMLKHMKCLKSMTQFKNIVQGSLWKKKCELYPDKLLIPYFFYADDLEINNALGSHSGTHSICNFYFSFPCFPMDDMKLNNIFLAAVLKSQDLKKFGNEKCLEYLVNEMVNLEINGIDIKVANGKIYHTHFVCALILGDNLALNSLLDFNKSFSGIFCRFCKAGKELCQKLCEENTDLLRNEKNYEEDIKKQNLQETGIAGECCFKKIPSFHPVENYSVDAMHDILEGICHYDLCHIIIYFIQKMNYLSLETLNKRKQTFEYGALEIENISPEITLAHLNKRHLKMSAKEMLTFVIHFPLMIGDIIPSEDEVWSFLLLLIEIIEIVMCYEVTDTLISTLKAKVYSHNQKYIALFNDTLKPKFHILTHYPTVLQTCGPVRKFWSFKYEAKHRQFKMYAHAISSRKNICLTLAKKYQFCFANYLLNFSQKKSRYTFNKDDKIQTNFVNLICSKLEKNENNVECFDKVEFEGKEYKKGYYISTRSSDYNIYIIVNFVLTDNQFFIFCQKLRNIYYSPHYLSFEVNPTLLDEYALLNFDEIVGPPVTLIKTAKGKHMIKLKEYFFD